MEDVYLDPNRFELFCEVANLYENSDLRKSIVKQLVEYPKNNSNRLAKSIRKCLSGIKVDGFRKGKAPEIKIISEISKIEFWKGGQIFPSVILKLWLEMNNDRVEEAWAFLNNVDADRREEIIDSVQSGFHPPDLAEIVSAFRACRRCSSDEPVDVFFCAAILLKADQVGPEDSDDSASGPDQNNDVVIPEFWMQVIKDLDRLPVGAEEWTSLGDFIKVAKRMLNTKEKEQMSRFEPIVRAKERLLAECEEGLDYLGKIKAVSQWDASACEPGLEDEIAEQIHLLLEDLKKLRKPLPAVYQNVEEEERAMANRKELRLSVHRRFEYIDGRIGRPYSTPETPQEPEEATGSVVEEEPIESEKTFTDSEVEERESGKEEEDVEADLTEEADETVQQEEGQRSTRRSDHGRAEHGVSELAEESDEPKEGTGASEAQEVDWPGIGLGETWSTSMTSMEIASVARSLDGKIRNHCLSDLLWAQLKEERYSSAYWIARYFESLEEETVRFVPSWLVEFIALSRHLKHSYGPIAPRLSKLIESYSDAVFLGEQEWKNGMGFLIAGAMLPTAMIAPDSGAAALLVSIRMIGSLKNVYEIGKAVIEFANYRHSLNPRILGPVSDRRAWNDQLSSLRQEASDWRQQAPKMSLIYQPATKVWIEWQKTDGFIDRIIKPVCENDVSQRRTVQRMLGEYSDEVALKHLIYETDRAIRRIRKRAKSITGRGLSQIVSHAQEAFEFARRWLALNEDEPTKDSGWLTEQIDKLRNAFSRYSSGALEELENLKTEKAESFYLTGGICVFQKAIIQSRDFFGLEGSLDSGDEIPPSLILNRDLLRIADIRLKEDWTPLHGSDLEITKHIIELQSHQEADWKEIFIECCKRGDHEKTAQILNYLRTEPLGPNLEELEEERARSMEKHALALQDDMALTADLIGDAVAQDTLTEEEYSRLNAEIDVTDAKSITYFPAIYGRLESVRNELEKIKQKKVEKIREHLESANLSDKQTSLISRLIDSDEIATAEEYIALFESGEKLTEGEMAKDDSFNIFFPGFINGFDHYMQKRRDPKRVINSIKRGQTFGPVDMKDVRGAQLQEAIDPIRTWLTAKKTRTINESGVKSILSWLGFDVTEVEEIHRSRERQWFDINAKAIRSCPIPAYGSSAHGSYHLLCVYGRPPEEVVIEQVGRHVKDGANIVFYFGRMTERQLRNLAWSAKKNPPGILLVDESVLFFLLGERGSKIDTLFRITLPFTAHNPYKPFAAGNVPPEMFYGRSQEMRSIMDPHGSCFIYGGRQLGKSALLRAVERAFHRPSSLKFAFFVDLKAEGLGETRPLDDIWKILHTNAGRSGIVQSEYNKRKKKGGLVESLVAWAQADELRRLLILLDETDYLLDEDAKGNFARITAMKKIMDSTERRVKFIFAGLHNVQRFVKIPNQPLAHLGDPICIGPLMNNGEWREARNLIEKPLNAMGYRFRPRNLVNRILAHTNYQPSLIQLFCDTLVRHLSNTNRVNFDRKKSPPYEITKKHVKDVYRNTNLRKNIRERFELTLNLDPRYKAIAYAIAHGAVEGQDEHRAGFSIRWITAEVNHWWPVGFSESGTIDDVRGLLDEMIGLGVLSKSDEDRYRLRSTNVLRLLGSEKDIEDALLSLETWELPKEYHSSVFRRAKEREGIFRSPVTGSQESDLLYRENGIRLVFGSEALGLHDLKEYLDLAMPDTPSGSSRILPPSTSTLHDFISEFGNMISERKEGMNLIFIPPQTPFSEIWVEKASERIKALRSQSSICRVFFLVEPNALFSWLKIPIDRRPETYLGTVQTNSLRRWSESSLERWLNELSLPPNTPEQREEIMARSGGWPSLLYRFAIFCIQEHLGWEEALDRLTAELMERDGKSGFLASIGLQENSIQHRFMKSWAEFGEEMSVDDLESINEQVDEEEIQRLLSFGETLGLCRQTEGDKWKQQGLVSRLLA